MPVQPASSCPPQVWCELVSSRAATSGSHATTARRSQEPPAPARAARSPPLGAARHDPAWPRKGRLPSACSVPRSRASLPSCCQPAAAQAPPNTNSGRPDLPGALRLGACPRPLWRSRWRRSRRPKRPRRRTPSSRSTLRAWCWTMAARWDCSQATGNAGEGRAARAAELPPLAPCTAAPCGLPAARSAQWALPEPLAMPGDHMHVLAAAAAAR